MGRYLIVVENEITKEKYLYSPFKNKKVVPNGYRKLTSTVPLNEEKYGHLPLLELV